LTDFRVAGLTTNLAFLARLVACPAFAQADLDTGLIETHHAQLLPERQPASRTVLLAAALGELLWEAHRAHLAAHASTDPHSPWAGGDGWQLNLRACRTLHFRDGEQRIEISARPQAQGWQLTLGDQDTVASAEHLEGDRFAIALDGCRLEAHLLAHGIERHIFIAGESRVLLRDDPLHVVSASENEGGRLTAPMPGRIVAHLVTPGTTVAVGTPLLILEAMKMEHTITAPHAGTIVRFAYQAGELVAEGALLIELQTT
ncbi:MAG TPA: 3-methylcrotonyl-CoA carboxylase, partial [Rhodocyclaceae bacterium]|nr:3-methylcrotonyl-CoA carboxylase [Rhodocyclaceae bacterium]